MTSLLVTCGLQFQDWSASYRLFSRRRIDTAQLFGGVRQALLSELPANEPLCVALDDSLLPKRGPKIHGVAWRRDPLGPPFQVNLIRAQRVLQFSAALTRSGDPSTLRMVPIDFAHTPTPPKPRKHAPEPVWEQYRKDCRQANLCRHRGEQREEASVAHLRGGTAFELEDSETLSHWASVHSAVRYDLIGKVSEQTDLTRRTVARILTGIDPVTFGQYKTNPEGFIAEASRLINEQKATVIIERLSYDPIEGVHDIDIFTQEKPRGDFGKAFPANRHIYDYVFTDSKNERKFVEELDASQEVVVYAKLPRGFSIPTPVGNYNPDWAIAFEHGRVRHVYFIAETKGSLSSMDLREIERRKIDCARKFFRLITSDQVKYDVVDSYGKLMELVS